MLTLVNTGRGAAATLLPARILLKADVSAARRRWIDGEIAEAVETSASTVHRGRQAWVDQGMEAAWACTPSTGRQYRTLDGAQEAQLLAVAGSAPPEGRARWTLTLLADQLVALDLIDPIRPAGGRPTRNKPRVNHGRTSRG